MSRPIDGPRLAPRDGSKPKKLVICLHGYGSNGQDLIGLGQHWARDLPHVQWVSPDAPDAVPGAPNGFQWFPISNLDPQRIEAGAATAGPMLGSPHPPRRAGRRAACASRRSSASPWTRT